MKEWNNEVGFAMGNYTQKLIFIEGSLNNVSI